MTIDPVNTDFEKGEGDILYNQNSTESDSFFGILNEYISKTEGCPVESCKLKTQCSRPAEDASETNTWLDPDEINSMIGTWDDTAKLVHVNLDPE
jgi:hypothetical protein